MEYKKINKSHCFCNQGYGHGQSSSDYKPKGIIWDKNHSSGSCNISQRNTEGPSIQNVFCVSSRGIHPAISDVTLYREPIQPLLKDY